MIIKQKQPESNWSNATDSIFTYWSTRVYVYTQQKYGDPKPYLDIDKNNGLWQGFSPYIYGKKKKESKK